MTPADDWERIARTEYARLRRQRRRAGLARGLVWILAAIGIAALCQAAAHGPSGPQVQWILDAREAPRD